jgi:hypothetical protein
VRIKQFLYDWSPPAWDHPALWKDTPRGRALEDPSAAILWIGTDYKGNAGASATIHRTTVEISVEKGRLTDDGFTELAMGFQPVDAEAAARILSTPFGELMYQRRHAVPTEETPLSYWGYLRAGVGEATVLTRLDTEFSSAMRSYRVPRIEGFEADTILVFGDRSVPDETEVIYVPRERLHGVIRLLRTPSGLSSGIPYPPNRYEQQPCTTRIVSIGGHDVYHAFLTEAFGQHEAVWNLDGMTSLLLAQPARVTSSAWFEALLSDSLLPA